jgi:Protein of unknown function (DUF2914)
MKASSLLLSVMVLLVAGAAIAVAPAASSGPTATAVICTEVKDRAPVGAAEHFPATVGQLYCFSDVRGGAGKIVHVWFRGDREVAKIELRVGGPRWRTWSEKRIPSDWTGPWKVEVRTSDGAVLATASFTVE